MKYEMNGHLKETHIDINILMNRTSKHGFVRTMERADTTEHQALRLIQNAWERGRSIEQLQFTRQRNYVSRHNSLLRDGYTNLRVYSSYLFIFSASGKLITMYPLPKNFSKKRIYDGKTKVRDVKKYNRFNEGCEDAAKFNFAI